MFGAFIFPSNDRSEYQDAFLAFLHEAAKLMPSLKASNVRGRWFLRCNKHYVSQAVPMEVANRRKILCQRFAAALVERCDKLLDGLVRELFDLF